jgi:hypothetical protein
MLMTVLTCSLAAAAVAAPPDNDAPPTKEVLAAITERGRLLAEYDAAAWHASDAMMAKTENPKGVVHYIAHKTDKGWEVVFGELNPKRDRFLIAYRVTLGKDPNKAATEQFDPPQEDTKFFRSAARAIDVTLADFAKNFAGEQRPYNVALIPASDDRLWVYFVPAPTKVGVWPLGGDVRYLVSADGTRIVETRRLHKAIIEIERPKPKNDNQLVAGTHIHVLSDVPEDTDVFHVLTRKPAVPELIVSDKFVFAVEAEGTIKYVGKREDVLKK